MSVDAERRTDHTQDVERVQLRANDIGSNDLGRIELIDQPAYYGGLACAHLPCDDDEALALMQPIFKISLCALMLLASKIELRVRIKLEGLADQAVMRFVHESKSRHKRCKHGVFAIRNCITCKSAGPNTHSEIGLGCDPGGVIECRGLVPRTEHGGS